MVKYVDLMDISQRYVRVLYDIPLLIADSRLPLGAKVARK